MSRFFVHPNIAEAETISTAVYLDDAIYKECREKIFASSWQLVGDTDMLASPGAVYPFTFSEGCLDEPLLLSRDKNDQLHCLSNVCTHRANILVDKPCTLAHLQCKYHGRRFKHNGEFVFMPEFEGVKGFPSERDNLTSFPIHQWGKWLFTSLTKESTADTFFGEMTKRLSWLPVQDFQYRADLSRDYYVEANWALYVENYLEGFHIPFVHAGLNAVIDYGNYTTELFSRSNLQLGLAREGELSFDLPVSSPDYGKKVGAYYFWIFPNMMFNFYPWGLSINIVRPVGVANTIVSFLTYVWDEAKLEQGAGSDLFTVEMEDEAIVQAVQRGVRSRSYAHGRYSVNREQGTHHFHRLLAEYLG